MNNKTIVGYPELFSIDLGLDNSGYPAQPHPLLFQIVKLINVEFNVKGDNLCEKVGPGRSRPADVILRLFKKWGMRPRGKLGNEVGCVPQDLCPRLWSLYIYSVLESCFNVEHCIETDD
jgi:hypothetical protein